MCQSYIPLAILDVFFMKPYTVILCTVIITNLIYIVWSCFPLIVLPATAILTSGGRTVTNQRVEVTQGTRVAIFCRGESNPSWKKGVGSRATSLPDGVTQIKSSASAILIINSLTPAHTGVYTCHIGASTVETVTVGRFTLSVN